MRLWTEPKPFKIVVSSRKTKLPYGRRLVCGTAKIKLAMGDGIMRCLSTNGSFSTVERNDLAFASSVTVSATETIIPLDARKSTDRHGIYCSNYY